MTNYTRDSEYPPISPTGIQYNLERVAGANPLLVNPPEKGLEGRLNEKNHNSNGRCPIDDKTFEEIMRKLSYMG